ncbi:MAG: hypothetical protein FJY88_06390 [Candidatus Eisenbacteria bacterium]|nr:hypothetical protein [Candidatus Eisenbacteria bacterium]
MSLCYFCSDLHGREDRYEKLLAAIRREHPAAVFLGGDLFSAGLMKALRAGAAHQDFTADFLVPKFGALRDELGGVFPQIFVILGNDDPRSEEAEILEAATAGLWVYAHFKRVPFGDYAVYGYSYVPPTPFTLKDWERYDVSRYVGPGGVSPEEGWRSVAEEPETTRYSTIQKDLDALAGDDDLSKAIFLFHTPPYKTRLDRAALDGMKFDEVPLDVHVGSIAVGRFIEGRQPLITLHGHVHESARLTGAWRDRLGRTSLYSAAHDGPELALVRFHPEKPERATRILL